MVERKHQRNSASVVDGGVGGSTSAWAHSPPQKGLLRMAIEIPESEEK